MMTGRARGLRWVALLLLLVLPGMGCRVIQVLYNHAEWLVLREADKSLCPGPSQRAALKQALHDLFVWHRHAELPRYARLLRQVAAGLQRPVTRELIRSTTQELEEAWRRTERQIEAPLVGIGMTLGRREAGCLAQSLTRGRRDDLADERESAAAYSARQRKEAVSRLEPWIGDLSPAQLALLARLLPARQDAVAAARARFNRGLRLVSALESSDAVKKRGWLRALLTDRYALHSREERELLSRQSQGNEERIWQFLQTLSQSQRARLARTLVEYAADFEELAQK